METPVTGLKRLTVPLDFNAGEEVHAAEAEGVGGDHGYVHLLRGHAATHRGLGFKHDNAVITRS